MFIKSFIKQIQDLVNQKNFQFRLGDQRKPLAKIGTSDEICMELVSKDQEERCSRACAKTLNQGKAWQSPRPKRSPM